MGETDNPAEDGKLRPHFGLLQAVALNVTMVVGAGVFLMIPKILRELPGPLALLAWGAAGLLILFDGLIWSELAATVPGSGGSYLYLLESYGPKRWGRLMAFLFVWQFLISGPLEIASGLIAISIFLGSISPEFARFDEEQTRKLVLGVFEDKPLEIAVGPTRLLVLLLGIALVFLLYRRIRLLGKLTVTFWIGVMAVIGWIVIDGALHFDADRLLASPNPGHGPPSGWTLGLGKGMIWAMYAYLGYYNICYMSDEVRNPGRTIPRSIELSTLLICLLFLGLHLAMLGTVSWQAVPTSEREQDDYSLPAVFMNQLHGEWAVVLVSLLLIWSTIGSAFAGLLGYSRIPFAAARQGHFFAVFGRIHPTHHIPHLALLLTGGLTLFWSFFSLDNVILALIATRILQQFIAQSIGVILLRRSQPERSRPYRMLLYPLPCVVAIAGWSFLYWASGGAFILLGVATLAAGVIAFLLWSWQTRRWPFVAETS